MTRRFRIFDLTLDSDLDFPELPTSEAAPHLVLRRADVRESSPPAIAGERHAFQVDGDVWLRIGAEEGVYVLAFRDFLTVRVSPPEVRVWSDPELGDDSLRHLLLNQVLPLIVSHARNLVLHAATIARAGRGVLLAGPAGVGKSTLAAALASRGWRVAGDDAVAIQFGTTEISAQAAYPGWRLWPDASVALGTVREAAVGGEHGKRQFGSGRDEETRVPLSLICLLSAVESSALPSLEVLTGRAAAIGLLRNAFVLDPQDRGRVVRHLDRVIEAAARVPVCELRVPGGFQHFETIGALLLERCAPGASACR